MKQLKDFILLFVFVSCCACQSSSTSVFTQEQQKQLNSLGVLQQAKHDCEHQDSIKIMLENDFQTQYISNYCSIQITDGNDLNLLLAKGISTKDAQTYLSLEYFHVDNLDRYLKSDRKSIQEKVMQVNMNLDMLPYESSSEIKVFDDQMLVNKYFNLPKDYTPQDLTIIAQYLCSASDHGCYTSTQFLSQDAADAFLALASEAKAKDTPILLISGFRSYDYQKNLYETALNHNGLEYADKYFARPGSSEHNTGLAMDITMEGYTFDQIQEAATYDWLIEAAAKHGFVVRYPNNKTNITKYEYEPWHFRYVGIDLAKELIKNNETLEEYYGKK